MNASSRVVMVIAWSWVGVPFLFGVYSLVDKVSPLFAA